MDTFFREVFKGKPEEHFIMLWKKLSKGGESYWFKNTDELEEQMEELDGDIYFGTTSTLKSKGATGRIKSNDADGLGAIHVDIDFGESGHEKKTYAPDLNNAIRLAGLILAPSIIVHSGNGIHAYYLLDHYCMDEDLERASLVLKRFQQSLNSLSEYDIDMTHDLSRILRCPGTQNCKDPKNLKTCYVEIDNSQIRYSLDQIEDMIEQVLDRAPVKNKFKSPELPSIKNNPHQAEFEFDDKSQESIEGRNILYSDHYTEEEKYKIINNRVVIVHDRQLDSERFFELRNAFDPEFEDIFVHKKKVGKCSCSEYDLSIANYGARFGLNEQELADLIIKHRRYHKEPLKATHPTYYGRTIYKALFYAEANATTEPDNVKENLPDNAPANSTNINDRDKEERMIFAQDNLEKATRIALARIVKYKQDPEPLFFAQLKTYPDAIKLGTFKGGVMNRINFCSTIHGRLVGSDYDVDVVTPTAKQWPNVFRWITACVIERQLGEDMMYSGQIKALFRDFMINSTVKDASDIDRWDKTMIVEDRGYYFFDIHKFSDFVRRKGNGEIPISDFKITLNEIGGCLDDVFLKSEKKKLYKLEKALIDEVME